MVFGALAMSACPTSKLFSVAGKLIHPLLDGFRGGLVGAGSGPLRLRRMPVSLPGQVRSTLQGRLGPGERRLRILVLPSGQFRGACAGLPSALAGLCGPLSGALADVVIHRSIVWHLSGVVERCHFPG